MAKRELYEPTRRRRHAYCSIKGGVIVGGGRGIRLDITESCLGSDEGHGSRRIQLELNCIEQFDPYLEVWRQLNTTGTPHPGIVGAVCASVADQLYMYGGHSGKAYEGGLSLLNLQTLTWSQLCQEATNDGGPMKKDSCGIFIFRGDTLFVIGGYGIPTGPTEQPGATFVQDTRFTDGCGWTNEIHTFNINQGLWSSPTIRGTRPPPCGGFSFTSIDNHLGVFFGGYQPGRGAINDLYIIDFDAMESTKVEQREGEPWPAERSSHAACCLGYARDDVQLLVSGGTSKDDNVLDDIWLFDCSTKKWKEVTLPDGTPPRWGHSATAISLCPGLEQVNLFGGSPDDLDDSKVSETIILTFERHGSEWVMVGVVDNSQRGSSKRVREKMVKITERAAALVGERQQVVEISQANERRLEERVREEGQRAQQAERRAVQAEETSHDLEDTLKEKERRIEECERRRRETEQQAIAREMAAEVKVQEAQQRVNQIEQETKEQIHQAEDRARLAERRSHDLRQRAHDAEQRSHDLQQRSHDVEQQNRALERRLHEVEQRARESERRARQAEAAVQQSQQESHGLVQRREIELTEEEVGRGGWAAVVVADFRGTRVAAKCFYQQILVSPYNRQLFNREMNMAARLRHPNLVQFIGASLEGEPIILTELMTTSLRTELEKGPISHAHITSISLDVARGLNYLHLMQPHPIIHRDISSANVLLDPLPDNRWKAKISDYGSVNLARELRTVGPGSPVYAAPEANLPALQSPKMDVFSFGVLLIEMLTDQFPLVEARQQLLDSIRHAGFVDLIQRCLKEDKEERPSANEVIADIKEM